MAEQNALPLRWPDQYGLESFIVADCNRQAFDMVRDLRHWKTPVTAIIGPASGGKTHLTHIFSEMHKAFVVTAETLDEALNTEPDTAVFDDVDKILIHDKRGQEKLFFLFNAMTSQKKKLLLLSSQPFSEWVDLPDLLSRLQSIQTVFLDDPDEEMVKTAYQKLFMDRGILLDEQTITYLLYRSERNFSFIRQLVEKLDKASLTQSKRLSRPFVSSILEDLL